MPHNSRKTRPDRRKAHAGTTVRIDGLRVSPEAWAREEALVAQLLRAGIPRAHRSGAMDLMLLQPDVAELLIVEAAASTFTPPVASGRGTPPAPWPMKTPTPSTKCRRSRCLRRDFQTP